ncbi:unnamed protein product [Pieris brassicae]|uniref:Alpha-carbonic anhydrase domain-containing protein n=1 Tax=Pieris brassicae TaxID=7116 RepID=A0A9P0SU33_PIEBR|nr:unnamed protein product [Pieris brassicae]
MAIALLFSDDGDLLLSSVTDSKSEDELRASSRGLKRVNYMQILDDAEFTFRSRKPQSLERSIEPLPIPNPRSGPWGFSENGPSYFPTLPKPFYCLPKCAGNRDSPATIRNEM